MLAKLHGTLLKSARLRRFLTHEGGATAIEYGLIAVLVSVGIVGAAMGVRDSTVSMYDFIVVRLTSVAP